MMIKFSTILPIQRPLLLYNHIGVYTSHILKVKAIILATTALIFQPKIQNSRVIGTIVFDTNWIEIK